MKCSQEPKMPSFEEVISQWDQVAGTTQARTAIHPAGTIEDEVEYFESGRETALAILRIASRYVPRPLRELRIADFGCGDGRILKWIAEVVDDTWAIDASKNMLDRLKLTVPKANRLHSDALDGRMSGLDADLIFAAAVFIHHDHASGEAMLGELAKSVAPGGILVLQIPCYDVPRERSHWTDVTTWSRSQITRATRQLSLEILELHSMPGEFDPLNISSEYGLPVILRRPYAP